MTPKRTYTETFGKLYERIEMVESVGERSEKYGGWNSVSQPRCCMSLVTHFTHDLAASRREAEACLCVSSVLVASVLVQILC